MKKKTLLLLVSMCLLLTACGQTEQTPVKVEEFGEIENTESNEPEDDSNKNVSLPYYDTANIPYPQEYKDTDVLEEKTSYYKEALSSRARQSYDEIYNASLVMDPEVALSKSITPVQLENVMNILLIDTPELFMLDTSYGYTTNSDGQVERVYLNYTMTEDEVSAWRAEIAVQKPRILQERKGNDYSTIHSIMYNVFGNARFQQIVMNQDGTYDYSPESMVLSGVRNGRMNSLGMSKKIAYWLRQCGINATISMGELIIPSNHFSDEELLVVDYSSYKSEYVDEQGVYRVDLDYSSYWFWNVIEMDGQWYNYDYMYGYLLNKYDNTISKDALYYVPDMVMSQTRLSYMNEDILGISPSCTDNQYQSLYRSGNYILAHTDVQMVLRLEQEIAAIDQGNKSFVLYQFENEETFNYFLDKFDEQMSYYNETYGNPIGLYQVVSYRDALIVYVTNIINNF